MQAVAPPVKESTWLPTLVVAAVLFVVVTGGTITATALSVPAGPPVDVGGVVRVFPLSGWEVAWRGEVKGVPAARLTRGTGNLDVLAPAQGSDPDELLRSYVQEVLKPEARHLRVSEQIERVRLDSGLPGSRLFYVAEFGDRAVQIEGEVTTTVAPSGAGVVFDGWGPAGLFGYASGDIDTMTAASEVF